MYGNSAASLLMHHRCGCNRDFILLAAICAGVDLPEDAGTLEGVVSTHSAALDLSNDQKVITARANACVDFAIETAKELGLFTGERDLRETIDFWKHYKRIQ